MAATPGPDSWILPRVACVGDYQVFRDTLIYGDGLEGGVCWTVEPYSRLGTDVMGDVSGSVVNGWRRNDQIPGGYYYLISGHVTKHVDFKHKASSWLCLRHCHCLILYDDTPMHDS
jgi:hypothetical protein